ncbi:SIR2 family protein [Phreatobacter sp.]|uniref:SIR2 family protein n=1 Tax=Phreatobacter sp. TaxID=1966341 RepID=UPI0025FD471C|nr:SIR2 family protein [Phreatobacter sp.]
MIELPPFDALALSLHHAPGTQALLVGSGLSRAAGIPTGWEITLDLVRRLAALKGVTDHHDWEQWFRDEHGDKEPSYSELLDALASTAAERRTILHGYIEPPESDEESRRPTKAHQAIARLVKAGAVKVIVTTNFDRLIENALRDEGIEPTVIASEDAIAGAEPLVHARCTVIKVHGDYLDTRIKNTDGELASYGAAMNALLDQVFDNFGLTVVGWSGEWDTALRDAIARQPNRRFPVYWAARGKIGPLSQDLIDRRGGRSVAITDADTFFVKLEQQLVALKQASRPHPQSIEMAIALAKRYCRDDRYAMEWAEFLHVEAEKIRRFVTGPEFPTTTDADALNGLVAAFIARTEVLRRACLVCGRWGTEEANYAVAKSIKSLVISPEIGGGLVTLINLRDFAASCCFYWNIAGLLDREKWNQIHALFQTKIKTRNGEATLVDKMPLAAFEDNNWKWITGLDMHKTPASDFLFKIFSAEATDIQVSRSSTEELFDRVEVQISIGFAYNRVLHSDNYAWFWMPPGRFVWKHETNPLQAELKRIAELTDEDPFFKAKLLGGSKATAKPVTDAISKFSQESRRAFR